MQVLNNYKQSLTDVDFNLDSSDATDDVTVTAGKWNKVVAYTVPAQQAVAVGYNEAAQGGLQGGIVYVRFDNASGGGQIEGKIRVAVTDANEVNRRVLVEDTTARFSASATDRNSALLLPEQAIRAKEDSKIEIWLYPESLSGGMATGDVDASDADTKIQLPVTVFNVSR